jgi:tRNA threonylcarbamoyladenosine modification (KEOPS) complex  Pcc1 subunit
MSDISAEEFEAILETVLQAVSEQYILPLTMALGTLTAEICHDPETAEAVADALHSQAKSCPEDVAGRAILLSLARLAAEPDASDLADVKNLVRSRLRLIHGQLSDQDAP